MTASAPVVAPLAGGRGVLVSAWREVHEGARADLLSLPGICRLDVRPQADTLGIRLVNRSGGELRQLPAGPVKSVALGSAEWDGAALQLTGSHYAFRMTSAERSVDVSVVIGISRQVDAGLVRVSAHAVLRDAGVGPDA
jgi:hypothetical protein